MELCLPTSEHLFGGNPPKRKSKKDTYLPIGSTEQDRETVDERKK